MVGGSAAAHAALLVVVLLAANWVSRPDLAAQALPIEATLVTQAAPARRAESAPASKPAAPAAAEPAPPRPRAEPVPPPPKPQPAKPQIKAEPKPQVIATTKPAAQQAATAPPASKPKPTATTTPAAATPAAATPAAAADPDKARREAELRARLAAEEHADALRASGAMTAWTQNIRGKVERAWLRPPSVTAALDCIVRVTQVPGGEVVKVELQACNGDASARESIEAAVYRASPLPQPADAALFERIIEFRFRPTE